jgi:DNA-binding NtrC family response regulator
MDTAMRIPPPVILVLDDDPGVGQALQLLFELNGLAAEFMRAPAVALERVRRGGVRVVIQDMNFTRGETSGDEGLAFFRSTRREAPQVSSILMTSWHAPETSAAVLREGAAAYLTKPWDDEGLLALVVALLAPGQ